MRIDVASFLSARHLHDGGLEFVEDQRDGAILRITLPEDDPRGGAFVLKLEGQRTAQTGRGRSAEILRLDAVAGKLAEEVKLRLFAVPDDDPSDFIERRWIVSKAWVEWADELGD